MTVIIISPVSVAIKMNRDIKELDLMYVCCWYVYKFLSTLTAHVWSCGVRYCGSTSPPTETCAWKYHILYYMPSSMQVCRMNVYKWITQWVF